jgi:hypothetical protein
LAASRFRAVSSITVGCGRLCENLELKSLFRSFGQEIIRDRLAGEEQNPTGGTLFRQKIARSMPFVCGRTTSMTARSGSHSAMILMACSAV